MSMIVTQNKPKEYTVTLGQPEYDWLSELAESMGMSKPTMLGAAFTKGIEHYYTMIREIAEHDKPKLDTGFTGKPESED